RRRPRYRGSQCHARRRRARRLQDRALRRRRRGARGVRSDSSGARQARRNRRALSLMQGLPSLPRVMLVAGAVAAGLTALYLMLFWDTNPPSLLLVKPDADRIDLYAENIYGIKYDAAGQPIQTPRAVRMESVPARGESILQAPQLEALGKDGEVWNTTAATGVLIGESEIQLRDDVVITDSRKIMRFETEGLSYFPERDEVVTALPVKLRRFEDITTAVGMRANLANDRIELLHKVNSTHVQP